MITAYFYRYLQSPVQREIKNSVPLSPKFQGTHIQLTKWFAVRRREGKSHNTLKIPSRGILTLSKCILFFFLYSPEAGDGLTLVELISLHCLLACPT